MDGMTIAMLANYLPTYLPTYLPNYGCHVLSGSDPTHGLI
jgi:hypothetical protein